MVEEETDQPVNPEGGRPKRSILERLNIAPASLTQVGKSIQEDPEKAENLDADYRDDKGRFVKGNSVGKSGRPRGIRSVRKMIKEKGNTIVQEDPKKRTMAQLLVDRLWANAVNGSERSINMIIEAIDGPLGPPEEPQKPIEIYKVTFDGTTIMNRRDEDAEDKLIESGDFIDVPFRPIGDGEEKT